jgi:hypothetical protein
VTVKKKRRAATAALRLGGLTPLSERCNWNCRTSSGEAVSGERPRKAAKLLTWRM